MMLKAIIMAANRFDNIKVLQSGILFCLALLKNLFLIEDITSSDFMIKRQRTKSFWSGLGIFVYSLFLFCQGIWSYTNYLYIYPSIYWMRPGLDYGRTYTMIYFTNALVLATPILGGIILMVIGYWIMTEGDKSNSLWARVIVLIYSFVLFFQTMWVLFGFPNFSSELYRYLTSTYIFINFPRFFILLGAVIPPLVGSILFMFTCLYLMKVGVKKRVNPQPRAEAKLIKLF